MPTIGHRWPRSWRGQRVHDCGYCRAPFPRHKLKRLRNGMLACLDNCAIGKDEVEIAELRINAASRYRMYQKSED